MWLNVVLCVFEYVPLLPVCLQIMRNIIIRWLFRNSNGIPWYTMVDLPPAKGFGRPGRDGLQLALPSSGPSHPMFFHVFSFPVCGREETTTNGFFAPRTQKDWSKSALWRTVDLGSHASRFWYLWHKQRAIDFHILKILETWGSMLDISWTVYWLQFVSLTVSLQNNIFACFTGQCERKKSNNFWPLQTGA